MTTPGELSPIVFPPVALAGFGSTIITFPLQPGAAQHLDLFLQDAHALSKASLAGYQPSGGQQQAGYGKHQDEHQYTDVDKPGLQRAQNDRGQLFRMRRNLDEYPNIKSLFMAPINTRALRGGWGDALRLAASVESRLSFRL